MPLYAAPSSSGLPSSLLLLDESFSSLAAYTQLGADTAAVSGGVAKNTAANTEAHIRNDAFVARAFRAVVKLTLGAGTGASSIVGISFGIVDALNYATVQYEPFTGTISFYRVVAGVFTSIGTSTGAMESTPVASTTRWLVLTTTGDGEMRAMVRTTDPLASAAGPIAAGTGVVVATTPAVAASLGLTASEPRKIGMRLNTPNSNWSASQLRVYV